MDQALCHWRIRRKRKVAGTNLGDDGAWIAPLFQPCEPVSVKHGAKVRNYLGEVRAVVADEPDVRAIVNILP